MAIPNDTITTHHIGEVLEEIPASMRAEDFPHIANLLINLYSDPIAAVEREYATNALDSHLAIGSTRPIEISLPTFERLEFSVQDYGLGLSVDDLRDVYSMYGRSLKRESNDFVGQLGLGCKSGLTYADAFTIVAVKEGVKVVAMSTKDEHGVGVIKVLDTVGTNEPNGVRITIPVSKHDVDDFHTTANFLFQFWKPGTVLIDGEAPEVPEWRKTALALDDFGHTFVVAPGAGLYSSYVVMGNVPYPVEDAPSADPRNPYAKRRFVAYLNMGDVDFVPSREAVHHTTHTDKTLSELSEHIKERFDLFLTKTLDTANSRWEETQTKVIWKGSTISIGASGDRAIWRYQPDAWHRKASSMHGMRISNMIRPSTVVVLGFAAQNVSSVARDRLREMFPKADDFIIVPEGATGVAQLEGRPNLIHWNDVVASTAGGAKAAAGPKARRRQDETRYNIVDGAAMTTTELADLGGKVLYLLPDESLRAGTLGATVVRLRTSAQVGRITRLVPGIEPYLNEYERQRKVAAAAVTYEDRRRAEAKISAHAFASLSPDSIDDPELAEAIRLYHTDPSVTAEGARRFGITIGDSHKAQRKGQVFARRYPLIGALQSWRLSDHKADMVLYLNAKYAADQAKDENAA